jgi:hypothetical protein
VTAQDPDLAVAASQMRAVLSSDVVMRVPSRLGSKTGQFHDGAQHAELAAGRRIPDVDVRSSDAVTMRVHPV